jgi:T-complex protein 1 subunit delta
MAAAAGVSRNVESFTDGMRKHDVRLANMMAAKSVADAVRTSLGPRGMDKMVVSGNGDVTITNDGATILAKMHVVQPAARMFVELSKSQDVVAGDGTTSVTVLAGSILGKCMSLVSKGVHATVISDALGRCADKAVAVLRGMAEPVELSDRDALIRAASTSLNSKVVSQYSSLLAPIAVDCVLRVLDPARPDSVDLRDVKIVKRLGGTVDDTTIVDGMVFDHKTSKAAGGPTRVENAKIALIQVRGGPQRTPEAALWRSTAQPYEERRLRLRPACAARAGPGAELRGPAGRRGGVALRPGFGKRIRVPRARALTRTLQLLRPLPRRAAVLRVSAQDGHRKQRGGV